MSQQQTLYHWCRCVSKQFPKLSKPQAWVLAAFSLAVARARRCALPAAAEALPNSDKPDSLERCWQRFLRGRKGVIYETMLQAICVRASDLIRF
jgi:hypothetical protein